MCGFNGRKHYYVWLVIYNFFFHSPKDFPITKKPLEVRQGKGKGNVEYWVAQIQPGRIMFEIEGVDEELAREAFSLASAKLPFETTFVKRTVM